MITKRRMKFTQEFKEGVVKLVLDHGYKTTESVKNLGIHPNLLGDGKENMKLITQELTRAQIQSHFEQN